MKPDDFEKQLQNQPIRPVPRAWRNEILREAREQTCSRRDQADNVIRQSSPHHVGAVSPAWWREWLWPCPEAWAGLAALWLAILGLNVTTPSSAPLMAGHSSGIETNSATLLAEQRRELARLLDNAAEPNSPRKPAAAPGPRSEGAAPSKA
jgi:hypothetical protein